MSNNAFLHGWDYLNIIATFSLSTRPIIDADPGFKRDQRLTFPERSTTYSSDEPRFKGRQNKQR
jgi:hypothetical protein